MEFESFHVDMDALYFLLKALCYKPGIYLLVYNVNKKSRFYVAFKQDPKVRLIETVNIEKIKQGTTEGSNILVD